MDSRRFSNSQKCYPSLSIVAAILKYTSSQIMGNFKAAFASVVVVVICSALVQATDQHSSHDFQQDNNTFFRRDNVVAGSSSCVMETTTITWTKTVTHYVTKPALPLNPAYSISESPILKPLIEFDAETVTPSWTTSVHPPKLKYTTTTTKSGITTVLPAPTIGPDGFLTHHSNLAKSLPNVYATYYVKDGLNNGHCSFIGYTLPAGIFGSALSTQSWANASHCGSCLEVTEKNSGSKVKAMIVDSCSTCPVDNLDLFENGFGQISPTSAGNITVQWQVVPCDLSIPLEVVIDNGSNISWFAIQFRNHNIPLSKVEVTAAGASAWQVLTRTEDNYFPKPGGVGSVIIDVRITDVDGKSITVSSVDLISKSVNATSNF
ncbi:RlpA-like double-psi beta-barrel-protein domain-containing protein-containing protein [Talaromyces proteolyticus]|uniref:RlpA-like double-psi beta-barrel-protein domain-containing protein-containing protein n=1 Tax=Talaromyces proteolyticus TaxID=1131652 RepID=A0AAD4L1Y9_9EURO|nr:RlpA-like double-psi beta-barrel-protein domain-containing protein-containing protein [Talaromyces proteolyticus]KAH8702375.1 RlpA-like double-psi beta-barrel-protein domain-containing protein-containing protein [Talaromyces proteolyticus]